MGRTQDFILNGNWGSGQHTVDIDFINGATDTTTNSALNLFVWDTQYNGVDYGTQTANLYAGGATSLLVGTPTPVGSGSDTLVLTVCEDAYQGVDTEFMVLVDGVQVGGVLTASEYRSTGRTQQITLDGNFGSGQHNVTVDVLNGNNERSLFLWDMNYDGVDYSSNVANLYGGGTASFTVGKPLDGLTLHLCEQAYAGVDVQFTISVDGVQIGGVYTETQSISSGRTQDLTVQGNFGSGQHTVLVDVLNGGGVRNLYVWGMNYDGTEYWSNVSNMYGGGASTFTVGGAPVPVGSCQDTLTLHLCEDALNGVNAEFTVSVDGVQIGGIQTEMMYRSSGHTQDLILEGNFGIGQHTVTVSTVNQGANTGNLFVWGMNYDGTEYSTSANVANLFGVSSSTFSVGTIAPVGSGSDTLTLHLCEDSYQGVDVQFVVDVDGVQIGGVQTEMMQRSSGHTQDLLLEGNFGAGQHTVTVSTVNQGANTGNLFVWGMNYDGTEYSTSANVANLYGGGTANFTVGTPIPPVTNSIAVISASTVTTASSMSFVSSSGAPIATTTSVASTISNLTTNTTSTDLTTVISTASSLLIPTPVTVVSSSVIDPTASTVTPIASAVTTTQTNSSLVSAILPTS